MAKGNGKQAQRPEAEDEDETSNLPATQQQGGAVSVAGVGAVPAFMQKHVGAAGRGLGNIDSSDVEIPRIKLLQGISKEVTAGIGRSGEFYHTVLEKSLGSKLNITPIFVFKSYILWRPRWEGGGILARAMDGVHWTPKSGEWTVQPYKDNKKKVTWKVAETVAKSGLDDWGSTDPENPESPPAATKMINIVAWIHEHPELSPAIITLQRSSNKVAKKLMGKLKMTQIPTYGLVMEMTSFTDRNANNEDFMNYQFTQTGVVQDEALFNSLEQFSKMYSEQGVQIKDLEGMQGEGGDGDGASEPQVDSRV